MKKIFQLLIVISGAMVISCTGPNPEETLAPEDKDVYVTNYDPAINFNNYKTFSLPDSVNMISNESEAPQRQRSNEDITILDIIKTEMQKLGYTLIDRSESPDLGFQITKIALTYTGVNYNPSYYYDPFWGGYTYYPSYYVYQVRKGSVIIDMGDLKSPPENNKVKVIWNGQYIDGLGALGSLERTVEGVKNLFVQSTYLKQNN